MLGKLIGRLFEGRAGAPPRLRGAPAVRRQKTYSAQTGYVYQYYYEGYRESKRGEARGCEYVFHVSADRKTSFPLTVFLPAAAVQGWERGHGRPLSATEQYAAAKMALFQTFDEREGLGAATSEVEIDAPALEAHLTKLDT